MGCRGKVELWGRVLWVHKVKFGKEVGYLLSSSRELGPEVYRAKWVIEVYFRDAKDLLPRMCLHTLPARLAVFASCVIASAVLRLLQLSKGGWKSRIVNTAARARRDVKQNLGLGEYQIRKGRGAITHWHLVFTAYTLLTLLRQSISRTSNRLGKCLTTLGDICRWVKRQCLRRLVD